MSSTSRIMSSIVGVGLVALHHRELGVVAAIDALVAEVASQFRRPARSRRRSAASGTAPARCADTCRDPALMVRHERARGCTTVEWLQDRRLHLHEALRVQELAHGGQYARASDEDRHHGLAISEQIEIPLAMSASRDRRASNRRPHPWPAAGAATSRASRTDLRAVSSRRSWS